MSRGFASKTTDGEVQRCRRCWAQEIRSSSAGVGIISFEGISAVREAFAHLQHQQYADLLARALSLAEGRAR